MTVAAARDERHLVAPHLGRFPSGVSPADGESLESYLDRLAYRHRATRGDMLRSTGLTRPTGLTRMPLGFPIALSDQLMRLATERQPLAYGARREPAEPTDAPPRRSCHGSNERAGHRVIDRRAAV